MTMLNGFSETIKEWEKLADRLAPFREQEHQLFELLRIAPAVFEFTCCHFRDSVKIVFHAASNAEFTSIIM
jgi:hypothetical protein